MAKAKRRNRYEIGEKHGGTRHYFPTRTIEWEWVHTGPEFARSHPLGRLRGGMFLVIAYVILHLVLVVALAILEDRAYFALVGFDILTLGALLAKKTVAYPLVWILAIFSLPASIFLVWYWADGVRPNLIYRHRFERLVRRSEAASV